MDIALTVLDDDIAENNENLVITVAAYVPGIFLGTYRKRTVDITILDDEGETNIKWSMHAS